MSLGSETLLSANREALEGSGRRFTELLRQVPDATVPAIGTWNVGETAAHVASSRPNLLGVAQGTQAPESLEAVAEINDSRLAADPERDLRVLADRIDATGERFGSFLEAVSGDPTVEVFRGVHTPLSTLVAVAVAELLVHGHDIARACGLPWQITREHAAPTAGALIPLLTHMVDAGQAGGLTASFELRIRDGDTAVVVFTDGVARVEPSSDQRVDCRISADPAAYLLLGFGRSRQLGPILAGKLLAWGRRPWLALKFPSLFRTF